MGLIRPKLQVASRHSVAWSVSACRRNIIPSSSGKNHVVTQNVTNWNKVRKFAF